MEFQRKGWKLPLGNSALLHIGTQPIGFPVAFQYPLRIAKRLYNNLWEFPSGFPTVSAKKNAHFLKLVTELCQFLGGS
jgi:hypothetical protein